METIMLGTRKIFYDYLLLSNILGVCIYWLANGSQAFLKCAAD
jgi:hypothetical protein